MIVHTCELTNEWWYNGVMAILHVVPSVPPHATDESNTERIEVELSWKERVGALTGSFSFPRSQIDQVEYVDNAIEHVHGFRVGTKWPKRISLGRFYRHGGWDFAATYHRQPGYVITLHDNTHDKHGDTRFQRVIVSSPQVVGLKPTKG